METTTTEYTEEQFQADVLAYEEHKLEVKRHEVHLEILKDRIKSRVKGDEKINARHGVIEMKKRDNWTYSDGTKKLAEDLKEKQKEEVAKGIATSVPTYFIEYRQKDKEVVE